MLGLISVCWGLCCVSLLCAGAYGGPPVCVVGLCVSSKTQVKRKRNASKTQALHNLRYTAILQTPPSRLCFLTAPNHLASHGRCPYNTSADDSTELALLTLWIAIRPVDSILMANRLTSPNRRQPRNLHFCPHVGIEEGLLLKLYKLMRWNLVPSVRRDFQLRGHGRGLRCLRGLGGRRRGRGR